MRVARFVVFMFVILGIVTLNGCATSKNSMRQDTTSSVCRFELCSPYYLLSFVDVSKVGCSRLRARLPEACTLAASGSADAAWAKVADLTNDSACTSDYNSLLALTVLLGGYLDSSNWLIKLRLGATYQALAKRLYELAPSNPLAQALFGVLLLQAPESLGGNKDKGIRLVYEAAKTQPELPVVVYGLWYGSAATGKESAAVKFAAEYLKICPNRKDILDWCKQRGGCNGGR